MCLFFNYKKYFSIVLQATADSNYHLIFVHVAVYGKQQNGSTFSVVSLNAFIRNEDNLPADSFIQEIDMQML